MDILSLILASSLMLSTHEMGHQQQAQNLNLRLEWENVSFTFIPQYIYYTKEPNKIALISGAGFRTQDILSDALEGTNFNKSFRFASAVHKLGYIIFPKRIYYNSPPKDMGDIYNINEAIGESILPFALLSSSLVDLYKINNPNPNWTVKFVQAQNGTPVIAYNRRF